MPERDVAHTASAIVLELVKRFDAGKISLDETKHMICFCTDVVEEFNGEIAEVTSLLGCRCTVCMQEKPEDELIPWNQDRPFEEGDARDGLAQVAYDNCFGDNMVGGFVCVDCARKL